ncbi:hypothetical protein B0J12DRAFT_42258 [Macrophomina phaseolina]|uniref:Uncharacterized protein n=1 Tax=Macrophomina phaseolina TaxID=35725 RepID=A0ABQ8GWI2_9PEZI|nr:hypothetical protein B0J12DRAFT_42258 [Macrophomina phaseolina]
MPRRASITSPGSSSSAAGPKTPPGQKAGSMLPTPPATRKRTGQVPPSPASATKKPRHGYDDEESYDDTSDDNNVDEEGGYEEVWQYENAEEDEEEDIPFYQERPDYLKMYENIQDQLRALTGTPKNKKQILYTPGLLNQFVEHWFKFVTTEDEDKILRDLLTMDIHTALIIGCVGDGGPTGVKGWLQLFIDALERQTLVCAVIGLVLQEHVFSSLCYGATPEQLKKLHEQVDLKYRAYPEDGFTRAQRRYEEIKEILKDAAKDKENNPHGLPKGFVSTSKRLAWQLYKLLEPVTRLNTEWQEYSKPPARGTELYGPDVTMEQKDEGDKSQEGMIYSLYQIVCCAGLLSLCMRLDPDTVYHMQPAFKDEFWNEAEMRAFNRSRMVVENPTKQEYADDEQEEKDKAQYLLALVRQTIFPGWKVYRKGGWRANDKDRGIRECDLERAYVGLRWGLQRRWETQEEQKKRLDEAAEPKKSKDKGKWKAKDAGDGSSLRTDDRDTGFKEWLNIWAEKNGDKEGLDEIKAWFEYNQPGEEMVFSGDEEAGSDGD